MNGQEGVRVSQADDVARRRELLGRPLRRLIDTAGLTVKQVATKSGVSEASIYAWISGKTLPNVNSLDLVLLALDIDQSDRRLLTAAHEELRFGPPESPDQDHDSRLLDDGAPDASKPRFAGRVLGAAPPPARPFVGRDRILIRVRERLRAGESVVLTGVSGVGKSSVALEYVSRFGRHHEVVVWIDGSEPSLVTEQLATAAAELKIAPRGTPVAYAGANLRAVARENPSWLIILDDASETALHELGLTDAKCALLLCARSEPARLRGRSIHVNTFTEEESRAMFRLGCGTLQESEIRDLVAFAEGLPLAIRQATSILKHADLGVARYLEIVESHIAEALQAGAPDNYPLSLGAAVRLGLESAAEVAPQAPMLLALLSWMAREPTPLSWLTSLPVAVGNADAWQERNIGELVDVLAIHGLATRGEDVVTIHGLTARLTLDLQDELVKAESWRRAADILANICPATPDSEPERWSAVLPHIMAVDVATHIDHEELRLAAMKAAWATSVWSDGRTGLKLIEEIRQACHLHLGEMHVDTLQAMHVEAWLLAVRGRWRDAYRTGALVYRSRRIVLGDRDPKTLSTAGNLATFLTKIGHAQAGASLAKLVATQASGVYGASHPYYWTMVTQYAICSADAGDLDNAESSLRAAVNELSAIYGVKHPATLSHRSNLAEVHRRQGECEQAAREATTAMCDFLLVAGESHPDVLSVLEGLARAYADLPHGLRAATNLFRVVLLRRTVLLGEDHPHVLETQSELGRLLRDLAVETTRLQASLQ